MFKRILIFVSLAVACSSCQMFAALLHDDHVVAKFGWHHLYASEVKEYIPVGISSEDSVKMAEKYIRTWADDQLFHNLAKRQLALPDQNIKEEIRAYKRALLRYRYEQKYVDERLDTVVTSDQICEYYEANKDHFILERPVLRVRFLDMMKDSPNFELLLEKMSSNNNDDLEMADRLAYKFAFKYFDNSDRWMDAAVLAREFGIDSELMLSMLDGDFITVEHPENEGEFRIAYVCALVPRGKPGPLEYCEDEIRSIIIHNRKKELIAGLEQDLLNYALDNKILVIYQ